MSSWQLPSWSDRRAHRRIIIGMWRVIFVLWVISVLFVISLPWWKFDGTPHWENVRWIPFAHFDFSRWTLFEFGINVLAFLPIGYSLIRSLSPGTRRPLLIASLVGFFCSLGIESYQLLCQARVPSTTDIVANTAGTILGAQMALTIDHLEQFCRLKVRALTTPNA